MTLYNGLRVTVKIPEVKKGKKVIAKAETANGHVYEVNVTDKTTFKSSVAVLMDGDKGLWTVREEHVFPYEPTVRTPLNEVSLLDWAKERVVKAKKFTTIEEVYTELLLAHDCVNLAGSDGSDVRADLLEIFRNGHTGYTQRSISGLMKEAEERFYGPDSSMDAFVEDLEGLLEFLGIGEEIDA